MERSRYLTTQMDLCNPKSEQCIVARFVIGKLDTLEEAIVLMFQ